MMPVSNRAPLYAPGGVGRREHEPVELRHTLPDSLLELRVPRMQLVAANCGRKVREGRGSRKDRLKDADAPLELDACSFVPIGWRVGRSELCRAHLVDRRGALQRGRDHQPTS